MLKKIVEFRDMWQFGSAFVPSYEANWVDSTLFLSRGVTVFSKATDALGKTPLSPWQQRVIYFSPLVIGLLPSFNKSGKESSHYPLVIYANIAKVAVIASVIIISRREGNHYLAGICTEGILLHAKRQKAISSEIYLIINIAIEIIGFYPKIMIAESLYKQVAISIGMVSTQLFLIYQFPSIKKRCNPILVEGIQNLENLDRSTKREIIAYLNKED